MVETGASEAGGVGAGLGDAVGFVTIPPEHGNLSASIFGLQGTIIP